MAASDAQKRAMKNYAETEQGKEARRDAVSRYQDTPEGREKLEEAKKRYESKDETKVKKAKWARERYHRLKAEKLNAENSD
jgi:DNA-binding PadR family transcriptional regulator